MAEERAPVGVWLAAVSLGFDLVIDGRDMVIWPNFIDALQLAVGLWFIHDLFDRRLLARLWVVAWAPWIAASFVFQFGHLAELSRDPWGPIAWKGAQVASWAVAALALNVRGSLRWFKLRCPCCGAYRFRLLDISTRELECRACGALWGGLEKRPNPSTFD